MTQEGREWLLRVQWRLAQMYGDALAQKAKTRTREDSIWERGCLAGWYRLRSMTDPDFHHVARS